MSGSEVFNFTRETYQDYVVFTIYRKAQSKDWDTYVLEKDLFEAYQGEEEKFIHNMATMGASFAPRPGLGKCLRVRNSDRSKFLTMKWEFWPGLQNRLPKVLDLMNICLRPLLESVPLSSLKHHDFGSNYLTRSTALVEYEGQYYIAKGPEDPSGVPYLAEEYGRLWSLDHPSIIPRPERVVKPSRDSSRVLAFLLKYYPNGNLRQYAIRVRSSGDIRLPLFCKWAVQLANALHFLHHERNLDYENIKPENCVVDEEENIKLIDFVPHHGCNKYVRAPELTGRSMGEGVAREVAMIFALGRTLWMVWEATSENGHPEIGDHDTVRETKFTEATAAVPLQWKQRILQCVDTDPDKRPKLAEISGFFEKEEKFEPIARRLKRRKLKY